MSKRAGMPGSIYQVKSSLLWRAEITLGYTKEGKKIRNRFSSMNREAVEKWLNDERYKLNRNIMPQVNDYTVYTWLMFWLETYKSGNVKPKTYDGYEYVINGFIKDSIGDIRLDKIKPLMIQKLYNDMANRKRSGSVIHVTHVALNQAFEQAIKNELMFANPCRAAEKPKIQKRKAIAFSAEEQEAFSNGCIGATNGDFFLFALETGMRCGEILALTWDDVDFYNKVVSVSNTASTIINRDENPKTTRKVVISKAKTDNSERIIPMSIKAKSLLEKLRGMSQNEIFVFSTKSKTMLTARNIDRSFHRIVSQSGVPSEATIHTLRHSFASRLIERGVDAKVLCDLMGHSSIQVTYDVYGHMFLDAKREAIALLN